jgi:hypothetical protein
MKGVLTMIAIVAATAVARGQAELVEVRKVWDRANHNAFTDLIRFRDAWFCTFREGSSHVSPDGALRVLTSADGRDWASAARLTSPSADLRDPKLSVAPDGRLLLVGVSVTREGGKASYRSMTWASDDGHHWGEGRKVGDPDVWLWRAAWHDGAAYGVGYSTTKDKFVRLYRGDAGHFEPIVSPLFDRGYPTEAALAFRPDGTGLCLHRRDGKGPEASAQLGRSSAPYTSWTWKDLGKPVGGPGLALLPDGRVVAGVRLYDGKVRTSLCWLDPEAGTLTEFLTLPSGGDTSYPGLVWHDDRLWVSYYSSHEGKTSIYLAKVKLPPK